MDTNYTDNANQVIKYFNIRYIDTTNYPKYVGIPRDFLLAKEVIKDLISLPKITLSYMDILNVFKTCPYFANIYYESKSINNKLHKSVMYNVKLNSTKKTFQEHIDELELENNELKLKINELELKNNEYISNGTEFLRIELANEKSRRIELQDLWQNSESKLKRLEARNNAIEKLKNQNKYIKQQLRSRNPIPLRIIKSQEQIDDELDRQQEDDRETEKEKAAIRQAKTNLKEEEKRRKCIEASQKAYDKLQLRNKINREKEAEKSNKIKTKSNKLTIEDKAEAYRLQQAEMTRLREEMDNTVCIDEDEEVVNGEQVINDDDDDDYDDDDDDDDDSN